MDTGEDGDEVMVWCFAMVSCTLLPALAERVALGRNTWWPSILNWTRRLLKVGKNCPAKSTHDRLSAPGLAGIAANGIGCAAEALPSSEFPPADFLDRLLFCGDSLPPVLLVDLTFSLSRRDGDGRAAVLDATEIWKLELYQMLLNITKRTDTTWVAILEGALTLPPSANIPSPPAGV